MLIWSFALSGHSDCTVLDLLIAASEMLLLLFHMDGYGAKGQGEGGGTGKGQTIVMDQRSKIVYAMMEKQLKQTGAWKSREQLWLAWGFEAICVYVWEMSVGSSNAALANLVLFFAPIQFAKSEWSIWKPAC